MNNITDNLTDEEYIALAKKYRLELSSLYKGYQYVPMGDAYALPIAVTMGCSYNRCLFCDLNHELSFKVFSLEEIEEYIRKEAFLHSRSRRPIDKVVLMQGNPFTLESEYLGEIAKLLHKYFPKLESISSFARVDDVLKKDLSELEYLHSLGYKSITFGLESGSDKVLEFHHKGNSNKEQVEAMHLLDRAGISYDVYIMLGLGGQTMSEEHVKGTIKLLNQVSVSQIIFVTLVLFKHAPLVKELRKGSFKRQRPVDSMREARDILLGLERPCIFNLTHKTNTLALKGMLPEQKASLVQALNEGIESLENQVSAARESKRWRRWGTEK